MNKQLVESACATIKAEPKLTKKQLGYNEVTAKRLFDGKGIFDEWKYAVNPVEMEKLRWDYETR